MKKSHRLSGIILIALILTVATFAFANANTVPGSHAGDGSEIISGYEVTNVHYTLDTADPSLIASVSFSLDAAATSVQIQLATSGHWYTCTSGTSPVCTIPVTGLNTATVASAMNLRVVATD